MADTIWTHLATVHQEDLKSYDGHPNPEPHLFRAHREEYPGCNWSASSSQAFGESHPSLLESGDVVLGELVGQELRRVSDRNVSAERAFLVAGVRAPALARENSQVEYDLISLGSSAHEARTHGDQFTDPEIITIKATAIQLGVAVDEQVFELSTSVTITALPRTPYIVRQESDGGWMLLTRADGKMLGIFSSEGDAKMARTILERQSGE